MMWSRKIDDTLSDNQRRWICRFAFLAFVVAPTFFVVRMINRESPREALIASMSLATGLQMEFGTLETPLPGQYLLHDVYILFPDTEKGLTGSLPVGTVEVVAGETVSIHVGDFLRLDQRQLAMIAWRFCQSTGEEHRSKHGNRSIKLNCPRLVVVDADHADDPGRQLIVSPLEMLCIVDHEQVKATIRFQQAGQVYPATSEIVIRNPRVRDGVDGTEVDFATGRNELPTWLVRGFRSDFPTAGRFSGQGSVKIDSQHRCTGSLAGNLTGVDISESVPLAEAGLDGIADCIELNCAIEAGKITNLSTMFRSRSLRLGPSAWRLLAQAGYESTGSMDPGVAWDVLLECRIESGLLRILPLKSDGLSGGVSETIARSSGGRITVVSSPTALWMEQVARAIYPLRSAGANQSIATLTDEGVGFLNRFKISPAHNADGDSRRLLTAEQVSEKDANRFR